MWNSRDFVTASEFNFCNMYLTYNLEICNAMDQIWPTIDFAAMQHIYIKKWDEVS